MLALRVPGHAKQLVQAGGGQAVVQAMKVHPKEKQLQVSGKRTVKISETIGSNSVH